MSDRRLYTEVAERIMELIDSGQFPAGSRLPAERDLAEKFGVSRVTVREALIFIQAKGRIEIRSGSGAHVLDRQQYNDALPPMEAFELTQARALIEAEAAALAATVITDEELDELDAIIDAMQAESSPNTALSQYADRQFHTVIARTTKNAAIYDAVCRLWRFRTEVPSIVQAYEAICEVDPLLRLKEHRDIADALRQRNPSEARAAMRRHFTCIIEAMLEAAEQLAIQEARRKTREGRERFLTGSQRLMDA